MERKAGSPGRAVDARCLVASTYPCRVGAAGFQGRCGDLQPRRRLTCGATNLFFDLQTLQCRRTTLKCANPRLFRRAENPGCRDEGLGFAKTNLRCAKP